VRSDLQAAFSFGDLDGMAYQEDHRGGAYGGVFEGCESGRVDVFVRRAGFADGYAGGDGGDAGGDEVVGECAEVAAGHVDDERGVFGEGSCPLRGQFELACGVVGGSEDELRGRAAVGERSLQVGGYGEGGGDAGDDLKGDLGFAEEGDLFTGAAEDERVTGFEPEDGASLRRVFEHEGVNAGLGDARLSATLADGDDVGGGAGEREDLIGDEVVGEDDVGGLDEREGAEGEQIGVAGARSDEVDVAGLGFSAHCLASGFRTFAAGSGLILACSRAITREGH